MKLVGGVDIPGVEKLGSGKVREMFTFNNEMLIVTTDRISAFDYILDSLIPLKGIVLNKISNFWFRYFKESICELRQKHNCPRFSKKRSL